MTKQIGIREARSSKETAFVIAAIVFAASAGPERPAAVDYDVRLETVLAPAAGGEWFQPRPAAIPGLGRDGGPAVGMAVMQVLGSDYFYRGMVVRCRFDGETLSFVEKGAEMTIPEPRGLYEKSIIHHGGRYFLTMRNDKRGYVTSGSDGLNFAPPRPWTFDDGTELGSYNTQQKWAAHRDALFLVYTRRGLDNDEIVRHRAPLVMARVDPARLCVLRDTERVIVPKTGTARFGNFDAAAVTGNETWITVGGGGPAYCARIRFHP